MSIHPAGRSIVRNVALNIRRLAAERRIALAHLADHAGIGHTTIWRLLDANDRRTPNPRVSTIAALAAVLDVEIGELFGEPPPS